jgi:regulatory protein
MEDILNKLTKLGYVDDKKFAESFVNDRNLLRPTSRRKLILELKIKKIPQDIINQAVGSDSAIELENLHKIIERKRRQTKYQDNLKLMQYLASQGFNYGDIKDALKDSED